MLILEVVSPLMSNLFPQLGTIGLFLSAGFLALRYLLKKNETSDQLTKDRFEKLEVKYDKLDADYKAHLETTEAKLLTIIDSNNSIISKNSEINERVLDALIKLSSYEKSK